MDPKEKTRSRYEKITIQDLGADSSEQYFLFNIYYNIIIIF